MTNPLYNRPVDSSSGDKGINMLEHTSIEMFKSMNAGHSLDMGRDAKQAIKAAKMLLDALHEEQNKKD